MQADFITDEEESELLKETAKLKEKYSFVAGEPMKVFKKEVDDKKKYNRKDFRDRKNNEDDSIEIVPRRVTGRPEFNNKSPWQYGDSFNESGVPEVLQKVVDRIKSHYERFHSGPKVLRDITINYREYGMFRLDPHVDPLLDGNFVFVLSLHSDVVFTLTPPQSANHRTDIHQISFYSWSDDDIDILLKRKAIVGITKEARNPWRHGIRTGLEVGKHGICDWFGSHDVLLKRGKDRTSIVFAFE